MRTKVNCSGTLRTVVVAGLLLIALLGAVLGSISARGPAWLSACDPGACSAMSL